MKGKETTSVCRSSDKRKIASKVLIGRICPFAPRETTQVDQRH
jgi:hypothetical protein